MAGREKLKTWGYEVKGLQCPEFEVAGQTWYLEA